MITGSCLCGSVSYQITGRISDIWLCHCSKCRKTNGSAFQSGAVCRESAFRWTSGEKTIQDFVTDTGYRNRFCPQCGSKAPSHPFDGFVWLPVGSLEGDIDAKLLCHIFVDSKAPWYEIHGDLHQFPDQLDRDALPPFVPRS